MPSREAIVGTARGMIGTRWRHQGREPGLGLDCAGVVVCTGKALGLTNFDTIAYPRHAAANGFVDYFRKHGREIRVQDIRPGSILVFRESAYPCHCGIVGSDESGAATLIHGFARRRKVVEERLSAEWFARIEAAFDFKGVDP